jgi:hypothetical protein
LTSRWAILHEALAWHWVAMAEPEPEPQPRSRPAWELAPDLFHPATELAEGEGLIFLGPRKPAPTDANVSRASSAHVGRRKPLPDVSV